MRKISLAVVGLGSALQPHAKSLHDLSDRIEVRWAASGRSASPSSSGFR
jgi:hypothetical protein